MWMTERVVSCDDKKGEEEKLKAEIKELEKELDVLISCGEGGDHMITRDLIAQAKQRLCELRGEIYIEAT